MAESSGAASKPRGMSGARIIIAAGASGGHIMPAIAFA
jgi:hypothetical protein